MSWWHPSTPQAVEPIPWLSDAATKRLGDILQSHWSILEFGAGGSTLWLAGRVACVDSVETNPIWFDVMTAKANGRANILRDVPDKRYDLLFIDGEPVENRAAWLCGAFALVKPGGVVVLDNANRPEYQKERAFMQANCKSFETVDGNSPGTKYLVTEFYTLKGGE